MYKPERFETVIVQAKNQMGELEWTVASFKQEKDDGEHFVLKSEVPWIVEDKLTVHYEEIYKYSEDKLEQLKRI